MRCENCPLCPIDADDVCSESEGSYGVEFPDGTCGCRHPRNWIEKKEREYLKHIDDMGISEPIYFVFSEKDRNALKERCRHMVGLDSAKPYRRNNRLFYKPYRNYFCAPSSGDELLDRLMRLAPDVMTKSELNDPSFKATDSIVYKLTPMGLRWLGHVLNIEIKTK